MVFDRVLELNGALSKRSESKGCRPDAINRGGTTETAFVPNLDGGGIFFRGVEVCNVYTPPKIATSSKVKPADFEDLVHLVDIVDAVREVSDEFRGAHLVQRQAGPGR